MDNKDVRILELLQENAKLTTSSIAKKTGMPITTVYHRIRKMEEEGIIERYSIKVNYEKLGKPIAAWILITIGYMPAAKGNQVLDQIVEKIGKVVSIEEACSMTGAFDVLVKVRAANIHELNKMINALRVVEQIDKTQTMIVLHEVQH